MKLYLLRHAIAVPREKYRGKNDDQRPLTREGIEKLRRSVRGMEVLFGSEIDGVLSSPCVRARHTAEIVVKKMRSRVRPVLTEHLRPKASTLDLVGMIQKKYGKLNHLLLVGHEPFLSGFISLLLGGYPELSIDLKKGGLCKLLIDRLIHGRCATLEWLLTPRQLLKMRS